jgi:hypothetical protein
VLSRLSDLCVAPAAAARLFERDPRPLAVAPWGAML